MSAVNTGDNPAYVIPTGPWYHFLSALTVDVPVLTILIVGSFRFWSLPAMVANTFMPVRTVFAWAFDRLLPERFAGVNERTHSPVPAILTVMVLVTLMLIWSIAATTFQTWLANVRLGGVPLLKVVAPLSLLAMAFLTWLTLAYPDLAIGGDPSHRRYIPAFLAGTVAFGLVVYHAAKAVRRSQGVDLELVYKELPPE